MTKSKRGLSSIIHACTLRWKSDLRELFDNLLSDPFASGRGRRWERDFSGEIERDDIHYAIFIGVLSLVPASIVAYTSSRTQIETLAQFFRAPMQLVLSGFLSSTILYLGGHLNRVPRDYSVAFKLMLRIMAVHPILQFLQFWSYADPLVLVLFGFFVIRGARKTYVMPLQNALLFYGIIYVTFAMMQLQALVSPPLPPSERFKGYSSSLPPSGEMIFTSSSRVMPS